MARCECCRTDLGSTARAGSRLDQTCNRAVNRRDEPGGRPGPWSQSGSLADDVEERIDALRRLHLRIRGGKPGWGAYAFYDLAKLAVSIPDEPEEVYQAPAQLGARQR
jgi:hypothetical protein